MILIIDEDEKTIYLRDFNLDSEELMDLAIRFSEYTFKSDEETRMSGPPMLAFDPYDEEKQDELSNALELLKDSAIDYSSKLYCSCEDIENCQKLIKCKLHIN